MIDPAVLVRCGHASVVSREDDDGVLGQPQLGKLGPNSPKAFVGSLEHAGKLDIVLLLFHPPDTRVLMRL